MKNKKGFTLVEILAVIVVLVIISVLAINKISDVMKKNNESAVKANALTFIKAVEENASLSRVTGNLTDGLYSTEELNESGIKLSGTYPKGGQVYLLNGKIDSACLVYDKYSVTYSNGSITKIEKGTCDSLVIEIAYDFNYTGKEQVFNAQYNGVYKIEAWGAQGGNGQESSNSIGGYGAYSVGKITLSKGDKLYINVGGQGQNNLDQNGTSAGGYNGGGQGYRAAGGGGATHVATKSGLLKNLENYKGNILIVAGAGGGGAASRSESTSRGGSGGGATGECGYKEGSICVNSGDNRCAIAGNQFTGGITTYGDSNATYRGLFGAGGNAAYFTIGGEGAMGGGGAGYYGGSGTYDSDSDLDSGGGAGGSGFINTLSITDGEMYCSNCPTSTNSLFKTSPAQCTNETATEKCSKIGNGYVKITFTGSGKDIFKTKFSEYARLDYIQSNGTQYLDTGVEGNSAYGIEFRFIPVSTEGGYESYLSAQADNFTFGKSGSIGSMYIRHRGGEVTTSLAIDTSNINIITIKNNKVNSNKNEYNVNTSNPLSSSSSNIIVANNSGLDRPSQIKVYALKLYDQSNNLLRNYIPCYHKTSQDVGLCDLVNGTFTKSGNSNQFIKGNDLMY